MRLTLRTLLAYLDNILDPADAELLGNKIDESEFATSLVHQIRGSVRRLRLDAPTLDAQGVGGDLNSVAEYLDNVLPPDQVPALEKACLDNEVNLGEVASCHQVLTLVLGEAAPVTDKMRHRAYGISPTVAPTELPAPASDQGSHAEAHPAHGLVPPPMSTMIVAPPSYPAEPPSPPSPPVAPVDPSLTDPSTISADTANKAVATPPAESRPSMRFAPRVDGPSTKETWRAESSTLDSSHPEPPVQPEYAAVAVPVTQPAPASAPTSAAIATTPIPRAASVPRKSSWLRSAFITGIVALLILAGLLFATGSIRDNLLTRWLGNGQQVVANPSSTTNADGPKEALTPAAPVKSTTDEMNVVSPNQQQPESPSPEFDNPPVFDNTPPIQVPSLAPLESEQPTAFVQPDDALPELLESNGFREPIESLEGTVNEALPDLAAELDTDLPRTIQADLAPTFEAPTAPEFNVNSNVVDRASEEEPLPDVVVTTNPEAEFVPNQPASFDNVPPESETALTETALTETALTESVPPLEVAAVEPPVASTALPAVDDLAVSTRLPREATVVPSIPEPDLGSPMEPTRLKSDDQLLLLFDHDSKKWVQVDSKVQLKANDHLLGLPAFKSEIEIGSGMVCSVHGVGRLRLGPGSDITLVDGNVTLLNHEASQTQGIRFHGNDFDLQMVDPNTTVAIEAYHERIPGSDISDNPHSILRVYPIDSSITVSLLDESYDVPKGRQLIVVDGFLPQVRAAKKPRWMSSDSGSPGRERGLVSLDRNATRAWKKQRAKMSDLQAWLRQKAEANVQVNQRSLATRSLAEMDDFAAIVSSLSDEDQHAYWTRHVDTLRSALTRGSDVQQLVRIELEQAYGSKQAELMIELLRGYNERQLAAGGALKLVALLDHANPELRFLAIDNLTRITNKTLGYRADEKTGSRSSKAENWRKRLKGGVGGITYEKTPELVKLLESFDDVE